MSGNIAREIYVVSSRRQDYSDSADINVVRRILSKFVPLYSAMEDSLCKLRK